MQNPLQSVIPNLVEAPWREQSKDTSTSHPLTSIICKPYEPPQPLPPKSLKFLPYPNYKSAIAKVLPAMPRFLIEASQLPPSYSHDYPNTYPTSTECRLEPSKAVRMKDILYTLHIDMCAQAYPATRPCMLIHHPGYSKNLLYPC